MEQYFSRQVSNCCHLTFSHNIFKSKANAYSINNPPHKPIISFTKKSQKKSLKRICSDKVLNVGKNSINQRSTNFNKQMQKEQQTDQTDDYGNIKRVKINQNRQNLKQFAKNINFSSHDLREKLYKSLQRQPIRMMEQPKRNLINQLKNYQHNTKKVQFPPVKIQFVHPSSNERMMPVHNFRQTISPNNINPMFSQNIKVNRSVSINEINEKSVRYFQKVSKIPYQQQLIFNEPNIKVNQGSRDYFIARPPLIGPNPNNYSDSFKKIYGEIDLQDQIKKDLMTSIQFHKQHHTQSRFNNGISYFNKSPSSQSSTMIPSESKLRKRFKEGEYFDTSNYSKQIKTQQNVKIQRSNLFVDSSEFKSKCSRRQKFKSIVSVNSQHDSSESADSIIIDQHPQKIVSSKPIKSLL